MAVRPNNAAGSELASPAIATSIRTASMTGIESIAAGRKLAGVPPFLVGLVAVTAIASDRGGYYATAWSWTALAGLGLVTFVLILSRSPRFGRSWCRARRAPG